MTALTELEVDGRVEHGQIVMEKPPALPEGARLHIRITVEEEEEAIDGKGWPIGFFERTAGSFPELERPPQGEYEVREPLG